MLSIWLYNYTFEFELSNRLSLINDQSIPWYHFNRCANYFLPATTDKDIVLCYDKPVGCHLEHLKKYLGHLPDYLELKHPLLNSRLSYQSTFETIAKKIPRQSINIIPWGWSEELTNLNSTFAEQQPSVDSNLIKKLNSKLTSTNLRSVYLKKKYQIPSKIVSTKSKIVQKEIETFNKIHNDCYLKDFFGVSGNLMFPVLKDTKVKNFWQGIKKHFSHVDTLLIEKKIDIDNEFSLQFKFTQKEYKFITMTGLISSKNGNYLGTTVNCKIDTDLPTIIKDIKPITEYISNTGYTGYLGFDFIVTKQNVVKMLEINARYTMGVVAYQWISKLDLMNPGIFINTFFKSSTAPSIEEVLKLINNVMQRVNCKIVLIHYILGAFPQKNHLINLVISAPSKQNIYTALSIIFDVISEHSILNKMVKESRLF
jgi:hypothetical protein